MQQLGGPNGPESLNDGFELVPADELRELTATEEDLFETAKTNFIENAMGSMVQLATQQGRSSYQTQLLKNAKPELIQAIRDEFEGIGYTTTLEDAEFQGQEVLLLTISWAAQ